MVTQIAHIILYLVLSFFIYDVFVEFIAKNLSLTTLERFRINIIVSIPKTFYLNFTRIFNCVDIRN